MSLEKSVVRFSACFCSGSDVRAIVLVCLSYTAESGVSCHARTCTHTREQLCDMTRDKCVSVCVCVCSGTNKRESVLVCLVYTAESGVLCHARTCTHTHAHK